MTLFEQIKDPALKEAFINRKEKNSLLDHAVLEEFKNYLFSPEYDIDVSRLQAGDFFLPLPQKNFKKSAVSQKKRLIYSFSGNTNILLKVIAFGLQKYDYLLSDSLFSFRHTKKIPQMIQQIQSVYDSDRHYVLKSDIHSFFESINAQILLDKLSVHLKDDPQLFAFISWYLTREQCVYEGQVCNESMGVIPGTPLSNFLSNFYLTELDREFSEKNIFYLRFSDDMLVITETEEDAHDCLNLLRSSVNKVQLELNTKKTRIYKPGENPEIVGFIIDGKNVDIAPSSITKMEIRLYRKARYYLIHKKRRNLSDDEVLRRMINHMNTIFLGRDNSDDKNEFNWIRWAFPVITRPDSLKQIDLMTQKHLRYAVTGKWDKRSYRVKYSALVKQGYKPLVRIFYEKKELAGDAVK